ncbi:peptidase [Saccharospirillum sp. MSK14-1]|uniref:NfeD family protein n=1 Tax=Saccharospirillum sp. MSK14-1 TaxID=1897632 RepID=UPI000D33C672|nr:NfeD family protein [Saccharospirillum sp. MSK14-1]PTY37890.1 peptidase [Saccharospirillum sp. MSK14-1]
MNAIIWIVVGILLILSELLATSVVAVFIGLGALVTGILLWLGWIDSLTWQLLTFSIVSLGSLVVARRRLKAWFGGFTTDQGESHSAFRQDLGERVTVEHDFNQGAGRVILNGVAWDALSDDDLKAGDVAWVVANEGIRLTVSRQRPN